MTSPPTTVEVIGTEPAAVRSAEGAIWNRWWGRVVPG